MHLIDIMNQSLPFSVTGCQRGGGGGGADVFGDVGEDVYDSRDVL